MKKCMGCQKVLKSIESQRITEYGTFHTDCFMLFEMQRDMLTFTKIVTTDIQRVMIEQDEFGLKKYGTPLNPMDSQYDWLEMAKQELADCLKYFKAEQVRRDTILEEVINDLRTLEAPKNRIREIIGKLNGLTHTV